MSVTSINRGHRLNCKLFPTVPVIPDEIHDKILFPSSIPHAARLDADLLDSVLNNSDIEEIAESYLVFDANHGIKKLIRWKELFPRVKPFFGTIYSFFLLAMQNIPFYNNLSFNGSCAFFSD